MSYPPYEADDLTGSRFEKVFARLCNQPRIDEVKRVHTLTEEQFRSEFASRGYPVIFTGLISPCPSETQMRSLVSSIIGTKIVEARYGLYATPDIYVHERAAKLLTVNDILDGLELAGPAEEHLYLAKLELDAPTANLLNVIPPPYYRSSELRRPSLWLGPADCVTPLHKDNSDNFTFHFFGLKRWLLFPVRDYPYLYMNQPHPRSVPGFSCSRVDVRFPDVDRWPLYRKARPIEATLGPGEVLYLPAGWAHFVETLSNSLMINYWALRRPACLDV